MKAFWLALHFLTRIPIPVTPDYQPQNWGRSALAYPLIGAVIGLTLAALQFLLSGAAPQLQAALLLAAWAGITGGLHLDGLADSADAWVGGHGDRQRTLDIMKDPRSGPAGVVAVGLVLLLKFAALTALLKASAWPALLLAPLLGRAALIGLLLTTPYVRPNGMGAELAEYLPRKGAAWMLIGVTAAILFFAGRSGLKALLVAAIGLYVLRKLMLRRLEGMTGDTMGASVELLETAVLVVLALSV